MTRQEIIDFCLTLPDAYEDYPFEKITVTNPVTLMRHRDNKKMFASIYVRLDRLCVHLKCDPLEADFLRQAFTDVTLGHHGNWNLVYIGGDVPDEALWRMIENSYDVVKPKRGKKANDT